jgi:hypothetical protein
MISELFAGAIGLVGLMVLLATSVCAWLIFAKLNRVIVLLERTHAAIDQRMAEFAANAANQAQSKTPALPPTTDPGFFVLRGTDTSGPFPKKQIQELRNLGAIEDNTLVARAGDAEWKKVGEVIGPS